MITILIPTYNRPDRLKRILSYYSDYEIAYNIIVADSSSNENKEINKRTISSLSNLNVQHLDNYSSKIEPLRKTADALNYVNTKYCVVCADDDFVTPNGINQSVDFLEKNPDFTAAHGYYISFYLENTKRRQRLWSRGIYLHESITFSNPKTRLNHHLSNYSQTTFYAVHRTDFLKVIFEETAKFTNDYHFGELLPSMLTLIYGKLKCLDVLHAARERIPGSTGRATGNLKKYIKDNTYYEKYDRFRECLSTHLSKEGQLDIEESKKVVDNAMSAFMKRYSSYNALITKMGLILDSSRLPDWLVERIRVLFRKLSPIRQIHDPRISIEISPSSEYYDDFNKIRLHVLSHSKR